MPNTRASAQSDKRPCPGLVPCSLKGFRAGAKNSTVTRGLDMSCILRELEIPEVDGATGWFFAHADYRCDNVTTIYVSHRAVPCVTRGRGCACHTSTKSRSRTQSGGVSNVRSFRILRFCVGESSVEKKREGGEGKKPEEKRKE